MKYAKEVNEMNTNNYLSFLEEKEELPTTITTNVFEETEPDYVSLSTIQEEPELNTVDVIKVPVLKRQTVIEFLSTKYKKEINQVIGNKLIKDNIYKCLIVALQVELNKRGANLAVNGIFNGNTKTAYVQRTDMVTLGAKSIFVLIWKYILEEKGFRFSNFTEEFDEECLAHTKTYQSMIKTELDGIVGFNLLAAALK